MTDNIKLPPMPQTIENRLSDFAVACAFGQHELRASAARELRQAIEEHALEAVRLNAQAVPDGWVLVPKRLTREMESVINNEDWRWEDLLAAAEAITLDEYSEIAASPAALQPAQPLTDEKDALLRQALEALEGFANITNDSQGVKGYHLNGDIAEWDEFDEVDAASNTIEAIRNHLGVKND